MEEYIILGIAQGIFEWLPISSEGIVSLISESLLADVNPVDIALFMHLGTFLAVLVYFWPEWKNILTLKDKNLVYFLVVATAVSLIIGFPIYNLIKNAAFGGILLIIVGFGLLITAFFHKKEIALKIKFSKLAFLVGALQGFSIIPGLSRSASTIFGLSLGGLSPQQTLKISYLMSAPVVMASSLYLYLKEPVLVSSQSLVGLIFSFLIGLLTLKFLINFSQKINFFNFALIFAILCFLGGILEMIR